MHTSAWKQGVAVLGLLVGLVVPATGQAAEALRKAPLRSLSPAQPGAGSEEGTAREVAPGTKAISPTVRELAPATPQRMREPGAGMQQRRTGPVRGGAVLPGAARAESPIAGGLSRICGVGFAKAIKPDHPGGFYECRLPAHPACTAGYEHRTVETHENRIQYKCLDDMAEYVNDWAGEGKPQVCPMGWTLSDPGGSYTCSSSQLACSAGHQVGEVGVQAVDSWPHDQVIYSYRCTPS